ncbi:MAG: metallophosphoesterase [Beijerinckiaceae bacterium]|nr:metallophosphoesterase [Beijerinckiaceae bacterium]
MRLVQISDLHLSASGGFFNDNWETTLGWLQATKPDLVVVSGDVALGGRNVDLDLAFARSQLERIPCPWRILPGNHDIGDNLHSGSKSNPVSASRLQSWRDLFGADCWVEQLGFWVIVGVNSQILNAPELGDEGLQRAFLKSALAAVPEGTPLAIFTHKPLFLDHPSEDASRPDCIDPIGRKQFAEMFAGRNVKFVACGHKHQYRSFALGHVRYFWAPAVACVNQAPDIKSWGLRQVGFIEYTLDGHNIRHKVHGADFLMRHESYVYTREYGALDAPEASAERSGLW